MKNAHTCHINHGSTKAPAARLTPCFSHTEHMQLCTSWVRRALARRTTPAHTLDPAQRTKATGHTAFQNTNKAQTWALSANTKRPSQARLHTPTKPTCWSFLKSRISRRRAGVDMVPPPTAGARASAAGRSNRWAGRVYEETLTSRTRRPPSAFRPRPTQGRSYPPQGEVQEAPAVATGVKRGDQSAVGVARTHGQAGQQEPDAVAWSVQSRWTLAEVRPDMHTVQPERGTQPCVPRPARHPLGGTRTSYIDLSR